MHCPTGILCPMTKNGGVVEFAYFFGKTCKTFADVNASQGMWCVRKIFALFPGGQISPEYLVIFWIRKHCEGFCSQQNIQKTDVNAFSTRRNRQHNSYPPVGN
ncbi:hypothetical protein CDAR_371361 [Caerostris darwini]|uniref:Uncharacterized protein n=1 Tax=Caerostris darwini TaxID=1538125 RepID=A0AAV4U4T6_9ARAC|nr:hypothetical protein CDAR_371271 [Caerostris darwini]GIY52756.1 hypothetical protein CDAR_371361 [Caerostris darwini]